MTDTNTRVIKFHYFSDRRIGSLLIRARLASKFQHVGIELDDGRYFESTLSGGGCHFAELPAKEKIHTTNTITVPVERYGQVLEFIRSIDGSKYDVPALVGFIIFKKFHSEDAWFCSEVGRVIHELATGIKIKHHTLLSPGGLRLLTETHEVSQKT